MSFKKVLFSIIFSFAIGGIAYGQSSAELKKLRAKIDADIAALQQVLKTKTQEKILSQREVNALSKQLNLREQKISTINSEIGLLNSQISSNNRQVSALKERLEAMRKDYEKMIMFAFRNKNAYNKMMFVFASKDFNQGYKRVKYLQQFNDARKIKALEIENTKKEIELKIAQLESDKKTKNSLLADQQKEKGIIAKDRSAHASELGKIVKEERTFKQQLTKKQQEKKRLDNAIKAAINAEIAKAKREEEERRRRLAAAEAKKTGTTVAEAEKKIERKTGSAVLNTTPEAAKLSASFQSNQGRLPWPVSQGNVVRSYGSVHLGNNVHDFYDYIRIRTAEAASVKAVFNGTVKHVINIGTSAVVVQHGEYYTVYSHLKSVSVRVGQSVSTGSALGTAAFDSEENFSYLEFSVYKGEKEMNPASWIAR